MASDGRIYITISDKRSDDDGEKKPKNPKPLPDGNDTSSDEQKTYLLHKFYEFAKSQTTKMVNYSIGNIGNFTGNYQAQRDTQAVMSLANMALNIGMSFAVNPVAGVLAVASTAINYGLQEYSGNFEIKKQNREIEMLRDLSGLNGLTNGGRV